MGYSLFLKPCPENQPNGSPWGCHSFVVEKNSSSYEHPFDAFQDPITYVPLKPLVIVAKARTPTNTRTESAKILNQRMRRKFDGTPKKPMLSVFCSDKQLYAMLVDDQNKKCLFYASTLQRAIRADTDVTTELQEAARVVGEELVNAAANRKIHEYRPMILMDVLMAFVGSEYEPLNL